MELSTERRDVSHADLDRRSAVEIVHAVVRGHHEVVATVDIAAHAIAALADATAARMDAGGRVIYVGAGSGGRLALVDAAEWGPTFSEDAVVALVAGADLPPGSVEEAAAQDDREAGAAAVRALAPAPNDVVIGVTASGRTPYVVGALAAAHDAHALTAAVISAVGAAPRTQYLIAVPVGAEVIAGSTRLKAGTAQKLVLNAFSTAVMVRRGRTVGNLMASLRVANDKLRERAVRICVEATGAAEDDAREALATARDDARVAILMLAHGLDVDAARGRLHEHGGAIARAIGPDQSLTTR
jgi:N-acetylmuramic acid 6-phosphate etherase